VQQCTPDIFFASDVLWLCVSLRRAAVFVSHSWHDDFESKWAGLERIAERFKDDHGREAT
jgi:hypothetical protein